MAQPIALRAKTNADPIDLPEDHTAAIESACELLQLLHDRGVLNLLRGLLGAGDNVVATLAAAADTPESIRAIRNFMLLTKFFASIPPHVLSSLVQTAADGANREKQQKAPGFFELYRRLRSENTRHAISVALDLIGSVGKAL